MRERADSFLRRHEMHYAQMPFGELVKRCRRDMDAALAGQAATMLMLPTYISADPRPVRGERVLVIDAGGTNLRAAQAELDARGRIVFHALRRCRMPGSGAREIDADELFREIAAFVLDLADCRRVCISFSYVFDALPDGDGRIRSLCKELRVRGAEGRLVCRSLERALGELGARGERRWRIINDSVGSLLGGMASAEARDFDDCIGFILGTGVNTCCRLPAREITRDPSAAAMPGEMIVNMESGCFGDLLRGTADRLLDAASELPGDHLAEKMISGSYFGQLLAQTLCLAAREGLLPAAREEAIAALSLSSEHVSEFCLAPHGDGALASVLKGREEQDFAAAVNALLLERAAHVAAACLCAVMEKRRLPAGSRVLICADGSVLRLNPILRPRMEAIMAQWSRDGHDVTAQFHFSEEASLRGCVIAALSG